VSSSNAGVMSWRYVPKLDGYLEPSLQSDFSLGGFGKELKLTCHAFSQVVVVVAFA
jgi:hypothetical protein